MLGLSRKWITITVAATILKAVLGTLAMLSGDFFHFIQLAQQALTGLNQGHMLSFDVYTGLGILLAPFFAAWSALLVPHEPLTGIIGEFYFRPSMEGFLLVFLMKLPILISDFAAGALVFLLVKNVTKSVENGSRAFLMWYLNPFNIFIIEIWGAYDVIPAALLIASVLFAHKRMWRATGLCLSLATLLRVFPILLTPVFLLGSGRESRTSLAKFVGSYFSPLLAALLAVVIQLG